MQFVGLFEVCDLSIVVEALGTDFYLMCVGRSHPAPPPAPAERGPRSRGAGGGGAAARGNFSGRQTTKLKSFVGIAPISVARCV